MGGANGGENSDVGGAGGVAGGAGSGGAGSGGADSSGASSTNGVR